MISVDTPLTLLGGLTAHEFMRDYWQRKPLLIRQAIPGFRHSLSIADIRELVRRDEVESRLIWRDGQGWHMKQGPFSRLPARNRPDWTVLAQSVDLHDDATAELLHQFRFIADARVDDAMISVAGDGGGVGPHFDSYDVFLLQAAGKRRWRISRQADLTLQPGLPLKILRHFVPEDDYILEPGDMLYLPPHVAHDGVALGECMTISIGFRAPSLATLACGMLEAANDLVMANAGDTGGLYANPVIPGPDLNARYSDPDAGATDRPARLPEGMIKAALQAVRQVQFTPALAARFLGQWLTEPSPSALFEPDDTPQQWHEPLESTLQIKLDRCTRMLYRDKALFINGEVADAAPSRLMKALADTRSLTLTPQQAAKLTDAEKSCLERWQEDGWVHAGKAT